MANKRKHYVVHGTKKKRDLDKKVIKDAARSKVSRPYDEKLGICADHRIALEYGVTNHAIKRYAERVLEIDPKDLIPAEYDMIAGTIRASLPEHIISETRYNLADNFYAVVNNGLVVTVIEIGGGNE